MISLPTVFSKFTATPMIPMKFIFLVASFAIAAADSYRSAEYASKYGAPAYQSTGYEAKYEYTCAAKYPEYVASNYKANTYSASTYNPSTPTYTAPTYVAPAKNGPVYTANPVYKTPAVQPQH
ncbi:hypothetical protein DAPPUDRAFT_328645 [Daphnia pulex]|uniref:Uncharacterized protein n=1 Tax=Daphnia pulex TaxID=6669 RepID=E9HEB9_DAPPU|nr:hypothetical protein DAPPUDRAFT_328645 [Daphnia pulex]|eukprot:EFX69907.1 hypothetical protein DAPPUDRAFT_328645 [Daphnia pulex]